MKVDLSHIKQFYFLGIGGIGMSALARYFLAEGAAIAGYDRTKSPLTAALAQEGCIIHYIDDPAGIPSVFLEKQGLKSSLVVYTPAIPSDHKELNYFHEKGYAVVKRAELLGMLSESKFTIAVAGTHGKTTTTAMIAHFLKQSDLDCTAFVGGISKNYRSNFIPGKSKYVVLEADEYDRSFLYLTPSIAVVTSLDPDHLDIYGSEDKLKEAFNTFTRRIKPGGSLFVNVKADLETGNLAQIKRVTYNLKSSGADYAAYNIKILNGTYHFDLKAGKQKLLNFKMEYPGKMNVENAVAAIAVALELKIPAELIKQALLTFAGVQRRFDIRYKDESLIYIDDYAHHPAELDYFISSVKELYPERKITGIFQPHLYSRTKDFATDFARSLSLLDEVVLLDIYPARERPIPGVTADLILNMIQSNDKKILKKEQIPDFVSELKEGVLLTMGAGDIDRLVEPIANLLKRTKSNQIL